MIASRRRSWSRSLIARTLAGGGRRGKPAVPPDVDNDEVMGARDPGELIPKDHSVHRHQVDAGAAEQVGVRLGELGGRALAIGIDEEDAQTPYGARDAKVAGEGALAAPALGTPDGDYHCAPRGAIMVPQWYHLAPESHSLDSPARRGCPNGDRHARLHEISRGARRPT